MAEKWGAKNGEINRRDRTRNGGQKNKAKKANALKAEREIGKNR
jgi:hypothetical protein